MGLQHGTAATGPEFGHKVDLLIGAESVRGMTWKILRRLFLLYRNSKLLLKTYLYFRDL